MMKTRIRFRSLLFAILLIFALNPVVFGKSIGKQKMISVFDVNAMGDMSDFDPANPIEPAGDTIKIALVNTFSGPGAIVGIIYYTSVAWAVHDINQRGGLWVDGQQKKIRLYKADTRMNPATTKKICERMVLKEGVHVLLGTNASHLMKVVNNVAKKYKVIAHNIGSLTDTLMDKKNFNRYAFMTTYTTSQVGSGLAYFYGKVRRKEKKFYILNQDYLFGHTLANSFKEGLKKYYPEAEIVGEDYHKLFLKDFSPYLTKIKASGAEVIFTGDWPPDSSNLLVQARQMGITLPFAELYLDEPNFLHKVGVEGSKGLVHISQYAAEGDAFKTPEQVKYFKMWNNLWKNKWKAPYNSNLFKFPVGSIGAFTQQTYWLLSVIERAKSTNPEKIIKVWENDTFQMENGKTVSMRACDHKTLQDLHVYETVEPARQKESFNIPPYYWYKGASNAGYIYKIPSFAVVPVMDKELCKQ